MFVFGFVFPPRLIPAVLLWLHSYRQCLRLTSFSLMRVNFNLWCTAEQNEISNVCVWTGKSVSPLNQGIMRWLWLRSVTVATFGTGKRWWLQQLLYFTWAATATTGVCLSIRLCDKLTFSWVKNWWNHNEVVSNVRMSHLSYLHLRVTRLRNSKLSSTNLICIADNNRVCTPIWQ